MNDAISFSVGQFQPRVYLNSLFFNHGRILNVSNFSEALKQSV